MRLSNKVQKHPRDSSREREHLLPTDRVYRSPLNLTAQEMSHHPVTTPVTTPPWRSCVEMASTTRQASTSMHELKKQKHNIHVMFLSSQKDDHLLNRLTSMIGHSIHQKGFCHVEICIPDAESSPYVPGACLDPTVPCPSYLCVLIA